MWGNPDHYGDEADDPGAGAGASPDETLSRRLQAALDVIEEGILICDEDGRIIFRNISAGRQLSSRPTDALAAQAVSELTHQALSGVTPNRRLDLVAPRRSLSITAFPIAGSGRIDGAVAVVEDVTERLRLESVRRDFVANVSHELKTPTGALALLAETIDGETDPQVVHRLVRRIGGEAERLVRIIDDLLDLSRIEANESTSEALVPVASIVGEAVVSLQAAADTLEVSLQVKELAAGLAVRGDRRDLISAVANLIDNAIKYSEPGGEVRIQARPFDRNLEISISDDGVGIPARDLERVFERFYRVDRARSRTTGGTGLGLSIVRHVALNHGGTVKVESKEGEGSTFVLTLPAVPGGDRDTRVEEEDRA